LIQGAHVLVGKITLTPSLNYAQKLMGITSSEKENSPPKQFNLINYTSKIPTGKWVANKNNT